MIRSLVVSLSTLCLLPAACQADTVTLNCGTTLINVSNPGLGSCLDPSGTSTPLKDLSTTANSSVPVNFAYWGGSVTVDVTSASQGFVPPGVPPMPLYLVPCIFVMGQKSGTDASMFETASFGSVSLEASLGHENSCSSPTGIPITVGTPQTFDLDLSVWAEDAFNGASAFSDAALDGFEVRSNVGLISATITVDVSRYRNPISRGHSQLLY